MIFAMKILKRNRFYSHVLFCLIALSAYFVSCSFAADGQIRAMPSQQLANVEVKLFEQINLARQDLQGFLDRQGISVATRKAVGLDMAQPSVLIADDRLMTVSSLHAKDMIERFYVSTTTPDGVTPYERLLKNDYFPQANAEYVDALALQNVLPENALASLFFQHMVTALANQNKDVVALFHPNFQGVGISVLGFVVLFEGVWHNVYVLAIDVATEAVIDKNFGTVVLGHIYVDKNSNGRYDLGEGVYGAVVNVMEKNAVFGPVFQTQVATGDDGFYAYSCPVDNIYFIDIFYKIKYQIDFCVEKQKVITFDIAITDDMFLFHS